MSVSTWTLSTSLKQMSENKKQKPRVSVVCFESRMKGRIGEKFPPWDFIDSKRCDFFSNKKVIYCTSQNKQYRNIIRIRSCSATFHFFFLKPIYIPFLLLSNNHYLCLSPNTYQNLPATQPSHHVLSAILPRVIDI